MPRPRHGNRWLDASPSNGISIKRMPFRCVPEIAVWWTHRNPSNSSSQNRWWRNLASANNIRLRKTKGSTTIQILFIFKNMLFVFAMWTVGQLIENHITLLVFPILRHLICKLNGFVWYKCGRTLSTYFHSATTSLVLTRIKNRPRMAATKPSQCHEMASNESLVLIGYLFDPAGMLRSGVSV